MRSGGVEIYLHTFWILFGMYAARTSVRLQFILTGLSCWYLQIGHDIASDYLHHALASYSGTGSSFVGVKAAGA